MIETQAIVQTATDAAITTEYETFEAWALRRKKPAYATKSAKTILRLLRALRTIDPTEDQVATWFDTFRSARCTRQGKPDLDENGDPNPPKNGTITSVAAYIKLYSRFRLESGRANGIARFLDGLIQQYSEDDSVSHPPVTPDEMTRIVRAATAEGDKEFVVYLHFLFDLGACADSILAVKWLDLSPQTRSIHLAMEKQSYNRKSGRLVKDSAFARRLLVP